MNAPKRMAPIVIDGEVVPTPEQAKQNGTQRTTKVESKTAAEPKGGTSLKSRMEALEEQLQHEQYYRAELQYAVCALVLQQQIQPQVQVVVQQKIMESIGGQDIGTVLSQYLGA